MKRFFLIILGLASVLMNAQTQIIAHRGYFRAEKPAPQNSVQALKNAQQLMVYGSEVDIRLTADAVLVAVHDEHHGEMEVSETSYADLLKLKLSNGENLPTLESYVQQAKQNDAVKLIVELKPAKSPELETMLVQKALGIIQKYDQEPHTEFISFSLHICTEIKRLRPDAVVLYLNGDLSPAQLKAAGLNGLDYHYKILTETQPEWIREARELGLVTNSWTVNDPQIYQQLKKKGIGFVTTDIPNILKNQ